MNKKTGIMKANHQDIIYHLQEIHGEVKSTLKILIRDMLEEKEGKRVELNGTLFDGTEIHSVGLVENALCFNDDYDMRACNLASTEDLFWVADNLSGIE